MGTIDTFNGDLTGDAAFAARCRRGVSGHFGAVASTMFARFLVAVEKQRSRHALRNLTDGQLRDIGISRAQAIAEARRPMWN